LLNNYGGVFHNNNYQIIFILKNGSKLDDKLNKKFNNPISELR